MGKNYFDNIRFYKIIEKPPKSMYLMTLLQLFKKKYKHILLTLFLKFVDKNTYN